MKKINLFGIAALALLFAFVLASCAEDNGGSGKKPDSMTFEDEDKTKEFTVYSNLKFKVLFLEAIPSVIGEGKTVSGKIKPKNNNNKWKDDVVQGTAVNMSSTDETIHNVLGLIDDVGVKLTYEKEEGEITGVTLEFSGDMGPTANDLMGGLYTLKADSE
jgi:hypothetical protein